LPDNTEFWIVDGQHRIEGIRELIEQDNKFADSPCPVVIMNASSEYEEAKQFMIINKTQKGVKSDLAERFIAKMARREGTDKLMNMPRTTIKDIEWRPRATDVVDILNKTHSDDPNDDFFENPWFKKIQLPNEPRGTTMISQGSFEDTLKNLLDNPAFTGYGIKELSIILVRYWSAILAKCPNAKIQPSRFVLQRTTGTAVLHRILPRVVSFAAMNGAKLTKESIKNVLDNMIDGMDELFWSNDGTAGVIGTSQKAWAILTSKVLEFLEEGNAETTEQLNKPYDL
jgi:DGQHR domain-containing protein